MSEPPPAVPSAPVPLPGDDRDATIMVLPAQPLVSGELPDDASGNALPAGTRMGEFELLSMIGEGGFGIVYLAQDHSLGRRVAIKEYMPSSLATRTRTMTVSVRSRRHQETFEAGLRSFMEEARLLARFDHPSLIKVYRFWRANGTAYMVMPYYVGRTLSAVLKAGDAPPDEAWLRALLAPVLDALEVMHRDSTYHRDIAPDNIMLLEDGRPVVLDLGAARKVISDMTQALTVILKTGYAPIEQYGEMPGVKQGPWTDLYALASVVYFAIRRQTPPQSVMRVVVDKFEPLGTVAAGRYSAGFLAAIDECLAVMPQHRPQSIAQLREMLAVTPGRPAATLPPRSPSPLPPTSPPARPFSAPLPAASPPHASGVNSRWIAAGAALAMGFGGLAYTLSRSPAPKPVPAAPVAPVAPVSVNKTPPPVVVATPPPVTAPAPAPVPSAVVTTAPPVPQPAPAPALPVAKADPKPIAKTPAPSAQPAPVPAPPAEPRSVAKHPPAAAKTQPPSPDKDIEANTKPPLAPQGRQDNPVWSLGEKPPKVTRVQQPVPNYVTKVKCNDLLQKSALGESVSDADRAFIRRECR